MVVVVVVPPVAASEERPGGATSRSKLCPTPTSFPVHRGLPTAAIGPSGLWYYYRHSRSPRTFYLTLSFARPFPVLVLSPSVSFFFPAFLFLFLFNFFTFAVRRRVNIHFVWLLPSENHGVPELAGKTVPASLAERSLAIDSKQSRFYIVVLCPLYSLTIIRTATFRTEDEAERHFSIVSFRFSSSLVVLRSPRDFESLVSMLTWQVLRQCIHLVKRRWNEVCLAGYRCLGPSKFQTRGAKPYRGLARRRRNSRLASSCFLGPSPRRCHTRHCW